MKKLLIPLFAVLPLLAHAQIQTGAVITDPSFLVNGRQAGTSKVRNDGSTSIKRDPALRCTTDYSDSPTYTVNFNVSATAAMDILTIGASGTKVVRLRRIVLVNPGAATAAIVVDLTLGYAGAAGSGGAGATALALDASSRSGGVTGGPDTPSGVTPRSGDTTQAGGRVDRYTPLVSVSVPATAGGFTPQVIYDASDARFKPLTVSAGSVIVLQTPAIGAGASGFRGYAEFSVDDA